jgi:hypothetical protein
MDAVDRYGIINTIYQSVLLSGVSVGYSYLLKRLLKINIGNPSTPNLEEILMLAGVIASGNMTLDYLYEIGLPKNPFKK